MLEPPSCPSWCSVHDDGSWWDVHPVATTCVCRHSVSINSDGTSLEIAVERFAEMTPAGMVVEPPVLRFNGGDAMTFTAAMAANDALRALIAIVGWSALAA